MDNIRRFRNVINNMCLQDEQSIGEALRKKGFFSSSHIFPLSSLHFELTSKCNAYCRHCYNNSGGNNVDDNCMTSDDWIEFAKYLVKKGGVFECLISGGEPLLLGEKLFDIMDILHEDGTIFLLMSNGHLLNDDIAKRLAKYKYHWLQISIDGSTAAYHDWFRQANGSWQKSVNAAKNISDAGIPLKIAHCITPYNIQDIDDMCDLAYSLGASSIRMGGISLSGRTASHRDLLLSRQQKQIVWEKVNENSERFYGRMRVNSVNKVSSGLINHAKKPRSAAVIRPNGDIRIDGMAPFIIGNILHGDFEQIWEQKIDKCWEDERVKTFISKFNSDDINEALINYVTDDVLL